MATEMTLPGHRTTELADPSLFKRGFRFYHARILSGDYDGVTPQLCQVTKLGQGGVYYRAVHKHGGREELGSGEYATLDRMRMLVLSDQEAKRRIEEGRKKQAQRDQELAT